MKNFNGELLSMMIRITPPLPRKMVSQLIKIYESFHLLCHPLSLRYSVNNHSLTRETLDTHDNVIIGNTSLP